MPSHHSDIPFKTVEDFLKELMKIQRRYALERSGAKSNRQEDILKLLDLMVPNDPRRQKG